MGLALNRRLRSSWAVAGLIAVVLIVMAASRVWLLGAGEIDYDEGVYWLSMQSMLAGHPLFTAVYSSQPPAFLLSTEPPWALLGGTIDAARAVMLFWGAIAVVAASVIGWRLGGRIAAVAAAVLIAVDPLMVRESVVLQADGPATSLALVAVALGAVAVTTQRPRWSIAGAALAGAALAVGILTKLFDVAALPPLVAVFLLASADRPRLLLAALAGGLAAAAAILLPLHDAWGAIWEQSVGLHVNTRGVTYGISLLEALQQVWYLGILAVAGAVLGWRAQRRLVMVGALWILGAVLAMAVTRPLWPHHVVTASPGLALLIAAGFSAVLARLTARRSRANAVAATGIVLASLAVAGAILGHALLDLHPATDSGPVVSALQLKTSGSALVLGDEQFDQALAKRLPPLQFVDTSHTRLIGSGVTVSQLEAAVNGDPPVCAVLFATGRLSAVAGFSDWVAIHFPMRVDAGAGRVLYVIPGCGGR
jgi:4-amino-4-deoxy-L-arabinose transferase-like glycosyltransferase